MGKATGRAKLFEKFDEHIEKDYDPEAEQVAASGSEDSGDENAGTEHYLSVGKSKLRQKGDSSLGPQYRGSKVSRNALEEDSSDEVDDEDDEDEDEEYDDPETANLEADTADASDSEISSDNALGESDGEKLSKFVFRGSSNPKKPKSKRATAADYMSNSEEEDDDEEDGEEDYDSEEDDMDDGLEALIDGEAEEDEEDDDDDEDDDGEDDDEDADEDDEEEEEEGENGDDQASKAKPSMNGRTPNADIEKGAAIQKQRKLYDGLLNLRIRLQKALVASNTFHALDEDTEDDDTATESYDAAEAAAITLLNTISGLRENCGAPASAGAKRKRDYDISEDSAQIWEHLQEEDRRAVRFREKCLDKWSRKVQSVNVVAPKGFSSGNKTLVDSLRDQLNNPENRLAKRTRVPRSSAPAQLAKKVAEDEGIFDDTDFYQLLLKELVEQRTLDSSSNQTSAVPSVVLTASRENKTRKVVDRKASKGRKMRFTVHEKLQNFMAPEDRRSWEQSAIDRFFGTLFGRKLELNEDEVEDDEDMDDVADADFKLFA